MRLVPRDARGAIGFYTSHVPVWAEEAAAVGLSGAEIAALESDLEEAKAALAEQSAAQQVAQAATLRLQLAMAQLKGTGSAALQKIRAKAGTSGEGENLYVLALIPPPAQASPIGPPGKPESFAIQLMQVGWLVLTWKCKNPSGAVGTIYQLQRQIGADGPLEFIGTTGKRKFVDRTLPAGASQVTYRVTALRSTARGPAAEYLVNLGGRASGGAAAGGTEFQPSGRIAA